MGRYVKNSKAPAISRRCSAKLKEIMRFSNIFFFILIGFIQVSDANAQIEEADYYRAAYNYLNDSIIKVNYVDAKTMAKNCSECCVKGLKLHFDSDLQVANKFIENGRGFPISDLANKKYELSKDCLQALRMGTRKCETTNQIQDSLKVFWSSYQMKGNNEIFQQTKELPSAKKNGYQVFFSDIYKNTLTAEIKSFCVPYDKGGWQGRSTIYFFVFNDLGDIIEIYSGKTIHYD